MTTTSGATCAKVAPSHARDCGRPIPFDAIENKVCGTLIVDRNDFHGRSRNTLVVLARRLVVYIARTYTTLGYTEIARRIQGRGHAGTHGQMRAMEAILANPNRAHVAAHAISTIDPELHGMTLNQIIEMWARELRRMA